VSDEPTKSSKRVLDPIDRISELLFGLIMVLTFTGSLSVAGAGRDDVHTMLISAFGCNLAWGIIDGVLPATGGGLWSTYDRLLKNDNPSATVGPNSRLTKPGSKEERGHSTLP